MRNVFTFSGRYAGPVFTVEGYLYDLDTMIRRESESLAQEPITEPIEEEKYSMLYMLLELEVNASPQGLM